MASYAPIDLTAPDADQEFSLRGCTSLTVQISNQAIYLTFGTGEPPQYGLAEPYLPVVGQINRPYDALKVRAYTPAAQLPAGSAQAHVKLIPR